METDQRVEYVSFCVGNAHGTYYCIVSLLPNKDNKYKGACASFEKGLTINDSTRFKSVYFSLYRDLHFLLMQIFRL
jgi:hypothetical protein